MSTTQRRVLETPQDETPAALGFLRRAAVGFAPTEMTGALLQLAVRWLAGLDADRRDIANQPLPSYAHPEVFYADADELWFDFMADTGDGFAATYSIARLLALPALRLGEEETQRGRVVIIGGDLVYPAPSREAYRDRMIGPFRAAFPIEDAVVAPDALVIPGDHDWSDGLASFRAAFAQRGWLGGWRMRQSRSYFDVALPYRWWLWGADTHLGVDVEPQRQYFRDAALKLKPGDRVIVCTHHPLWRSLEEDDVIQLRALESIIAERDAEPVLYLAGHDHHYAHYRNRDSSAHYLTSGGGGTSTEDTIRLADSIAVSRLGKPDQLMLAECFPSKIESKKLARKAAPLPTMMSVQIAGIISLLWLMTALLSGLISGWVPRTEANASIWEQRPLILGIAVTFTLISCILVFHNGRVRNKVASFGAGTLHAAAHLAGVFGAFELAVRFSRGYAIATSVVFVVACFLVTLGVNRLYLIATTWLTDQHTSQFFGAMLVGDFKNFLRMHIARDGTLTIFPIGVTEMPAHRDWTLNTKAPAGAPWFELANGARIEDRAALIHAPIVIAPSEAQRRAVLAPQSMRDPPYDVFISYSRLDARWVRTFVDALEETATARGIREPRVFVDTASIALNDFWHARILEEIGRCHVFVSVISPGYVASYEDRRMCFVEHETARVREADVKRPLVFDVLAVEAKLPASLGARNMANLTKVPLEQLHDAETLRSFIAAVLDQVVAARGTV